MGLPQYPAVPLIAVYLREVEIRVQTGLYVEVKAALCRVNSNWKQAKCLSSGRRINSVHYLWFFFVPESVVHSSKLTHTTMWMSHKYIILSKRSHTGGYAVCFHLYAIVEERVSSGYVQIGGCLGLGWEGRAWLPRDTLNLCGWRRCFVSWLWGWLHWHTHGSQPIKLLPECMLSIIYELRLIGN